MKAENNCKTAVQSVAYPAVKYLRMPILRNKRQTQPRDNELVSGTSPSHKAELTTKSISNSVTKIDGIHIWLLGGRTEPGNESQDNFVIYG